MLARVKETIERYEMLKPGERVLVAVSGGIDSMALLTSLAELREELELSLTVAHLDHRMRPGSAEDARFVAERARSLGLPVVCRRVDVPATVRAERLSPEEGARRVRYRFFKEAAQEVQANAVALGHTLNDRVETFLLNLLRGAGLAGLVGMPPVRREGDLRYVRPLIGLSREEIERYAQERELPYREDPTNRDPRYLRNRVRHELLPLLKEFNPNLLETVARTAEALRLTHEHLDRAARRALEAAVLSEGPEEITLSAGRVRRLEPPVRRHLLRAALRRVKGDLRDIESVHIEDVLGELAKGHSGNQIALPEGIRAVYQEGRLIFTRKPQRERRAPYRFPLRLDGENRLFEIGWRFDLEVWEGSHPTPGDRLEAHIDRAKMVEPLIVRNRRPGDRFRPLGLGGTKKLQDFFVDEKVPREERDEIPLLCDQRGILWVVGHRLSERARVTPATGRTLRVRAEPLDPKAGEERGEGA